ncbi:PucR family transcriptional regulator [Nakamurella sp. YIM 132087]|uniref:PucR family transcriptional regulator n=1 Tax=Nakamurella alba TaxID=2665158 RepID=A0A7K1FQV9_9ACTN|nr:PucR family transcriptional regulator ligand-binding domain-containing protein [Nakamurella alba]MTD15174.1 PucR family transcriptional regulator [Nakamurella alba]
MATPARTATPPAAPRPRTVPGRLTVAGVLALPAAAAGRPMVLAGRAGLSAPVRWLHVSELTDVEGLFHGGELVLTTGLALPDDPGQCRAYVDALAKQRVVGLVLELGRRLSRAPDALVAACARAVLPLIVIRREVPFVDLVEAAQRVLLDERTAVEQAVADARERFTALCLAEASVDEIVSAAAALTGGQVVFADPRRRVLALDADNGPVELLLARWRRRSGSAPVDDRTTVDPHTGTVATPVVVRGRIRGQLLLFAASPGPADEEILEQAAAALTLRLLAGRDDGPVTTARTAVLADLLSGDVRATSVAVARAAALGVELRDRRFVPVLVDGIGADPTDRIHQAAQRSGLDVLVGPQSAARWVVLVLLRRDQDESGIDVLAATLHGRRNARELVIAAGTATADLGDLPAALAEATDVADAVRLGPPGPPRCHRVDDLRLRGVLTLLRDEPRLRAFAARSLGPLLQRDARDGGDLVATLAGYLDVRGNKARAARLLGISRPTLYERLARITRLLRVDVEDPETMTSLHAAIMLAGR